MDALLAGAIGMAAFVAGLFFLRFWRHTRDRFFLWFALSFWLEAIDRVALGLVSGAGEDNPVFYGMRVVSYGLILFAIWQKNRPRDGRD